MTPPPLPLSREERQSRALLAAGIGGAYIFALVLPFLPKLAIGSWSFCAFHKLTGLPCPFCGGTRATRSLLNGDWHQAIYLNPLSIVVLGFGIVFTLLWTVEAIRGRELFHRPRKTSIARTFQVLGVAILAWWAFHIYDAVRTPKPELVDFGNPVAETVRRAVVK
jgi:hypothetical protein